MTFLELLKASNNKIDPEVHQTYWELERCLSDYEHVPLNLALNTHAGQFTTTCTSFLERTDSSGLYR